MTTVISVENLGKKYTLRHEQRQSYRALRDVLADGMSSIGQRILHPFHRPAAEHQAFEEFWALKDVSFEVKQGDRVGIIGRNGAGKSTLLKILSRITEPTRGRVKIKGRVASLLEVGTGFHPELTGRENIYLNGAILGMSRAEIRKKFDEIVDFAEVEKFLDTPVKRYSSGMYVRLAFAVAAHLEPEILVVDEVLAVGDAQFQKKCLGKMEDVGKEGRTVLFVSHNMAAIQKLCTKGMVLQQGRVLSVGTEAEAVTAYLARQTPVDVSLKSHIDRQGSGLVRVESVRFFDAEGFEIQSAVSGQSISVRLYFYTHTKEPLRRVMASILVRTQLEFPVFLQHNRLTQNDFGVLPERGYFELKIPSLPLPPSMYRVDYSLMKDGLYLDFVSDAIELPVVGGDFFGSGEVPPISHGVCLVGGQWSMNPV